MQEPGNIKGSWKMANSKQTEEVKHTAVNCHSIVFYRVSLASESD